VGHELGHEVTYVVGWVGSVKSWVGLGWVTENGPTAMSVIAASYPQPGTSQHCKTTDTGWCIT